MNIKSRFAFTDDDWHPNYPNNQVKVILNTDVATKDNVVHVVSVWGEDDFGLEKVFYGEDQRQPAIDLYANILSWSIVRQEVLKSIGFKSA